MHHLLRLVLAVLLAIGAAFTGAGAAEAAPATGYHQLGNDRQLKCLVVRGGAEGAPVVGTECLGYVDQLWLFQRVGTSSPAVYQIKNYNSLKCIVARTSGSQIHKAVQTGCRNYADQLWQPVQVSSGFFQLKNRNSGLCLILQRPNELTQAYQGTCNANYADQVWYQF